MVNEYDEQWNLMADYWDSRDDWGYERLLVPTIISLLGDVAGFNIIDIGCGTGDLTRRLSQLGANLLGVDFSKEMLNVAQKHEVISTTRIKFLLTDVTHLEVKTSSQDIAIANLTIQAIENYELVFSEISRVLKPNGIFIFSIEHPFFALGRKEHVLTNRNWADSSLDDEKNEPLSYFSEHKQIIEWPNKRTTSHFFRPLSAYSGSLQRNGFSILEIREPKPINIEEADSERFRIFNLLPRFLVAKCQQSSSPQRTIVKTKETQKSLGDLQTEACEWMQEVGTDKWHPLSILAQIMEELGESSRIINSLYGDKTPKPSEKFDLEELGLELGGLLFALACLAGKLNINLSIHFEKTLEKYRVRDINRFHNGSHQEKAT